MRRNFKFGCIAACALLLSSQGAALAQTSSGRDRTIKVTMDDAMRWLGERGTASFYGGKWDGRLAASGIRFDQRLFTAAHPWLPFGTRVRVTLGDTGRSVIVTITDRLYSSRRIVDLSRAAAQALGMMRLGLAEVTLAPD